MLIHPCFQVSRDHLVWCTGQGNMRSEIKPTTTREETRSYITWTTTPQPENASRSTAFISVCEIVSKRSSGSWVIEARVSESVGGEGVDDATEATHKVGLPQALRNPKEFVRRRSAYDKILGKVDAADHVRRCDERFVGPFGQTGDNGFNVVRSKSGLIQMRKRVGKKTRKIALQPHRFSYSVELTR